MKCPVCGEQMERDEGGMTSSFRRHPSPILRGYEPGIYANYSCSYGCGNEYQWTPGEGLRLRTDNGLESRDIFGEGPLIESLVDAATP